jgi:hypothetical protein
MHGINFMVAMGDPFDKVLLAEESCFVACYMVEMVGFEVGLEQKGTAQVVVLDMVLS